MTNALMPLQSSSPIQGDAAKPVMNLSKTKDRQSAHAAAQNFEAMFMNEMMSYMFQGLETDGPFGGGHGEEVFRSLMVEEYSKKIANSGQTQIAASVEKEMLKMQEMQQNPNKLITTKVNHATA